MQYWSLLNFLWNPVEVLHCHSYGKSKQQMVHKLQWLFLSLKNQCGMIFALRGQLLHIEVSTKLTKGFLTKIFRLGRIHWPIPRINGSVCLNSTTNCDSCLTKNVSIQSTNDSNSQCVIKPKWISNCQALLPNFERRWLPGHHWS